MEMPAAVTANTIPVTQQAQQLFEDTVNNLQTIAQAVDETRLHLVSNAMVSQSSAIWGAAVNQWGEEFNKIIQDTQAMADMLGQTVQIIQQNESNQSELAGALQNQVASFTPA
jgi:hypothetical protein